MAKPQSSYPDAATKGGHEEPTGAGEQALQEALDRHGEELSAVVEATDDLDDLLVTAILIIATADEEEIEHVTESLSALVTAGDGLTTEETAELATMVGDNGDELAGALDLLLEPYRSGELEELVETARMLTVIDIDEDAARGLNRLVRAVGEAERATTDSRGLLDSLRGIDGRDVRTTIQYLIGLVRGLGGGSKG